MMSSLPFSTYDVFLSFRGEDTRSGFTGSLYRILCANGIRTFIDEKELQKGNQIATSLLKGIQTSKIAIVVLSENYASSSFCLDELVNILDYSRKNKDALVLPIFYKVDPSHVRHERGKYGEALANHEKKYEASVLDEWKKALTEVANLLGFHVKQGDKCEDDLTIHEIVERVSSEINHAPLQGGPLLCGGLLIENSLVKIGNRGHFRLYDLIENMAKLTFSKELRLWFYNEQNTSTLQLDLTVKLKDQQTNELKIIPVELQLRKGCHFGEQFLIVGDDPMVGSWNPSDALPLTWSEGHVWTVHLDIPAGKPIQYKLIMKGGTNTIVWQPGPDRILQPRENMIRATICEYWENA